MDSGNKALRKLALASASVLPLCMIFASPAEAQEAAQNRDIVVTALKRSEKLQDVPAPISAIDSNALEDASIVNTEGLSALTTGVSINSNAQFVTPYIRGVGTQYANPGLEPSVAIYLDDMYISRASGGLLALSDVERVEILKGPQGTLYGMSNTGGAVRIITKEPSNKFGAGGSVSLGNFGQFGADAYVTGPIADNVRGRLSLQRDQSDGWVKPRSGTGPTLEDRDLWTLRGKLAWDVSSKITVKLSADYTRKEDHEGQAFIGLFPGVPEQTAVALGGVPADGLYRQSTNLTDDDKMSLEAGGAQLRIDYETPYGLLTSITGYRKTEFSGKADLDGTNLPFYNGNTFIENTEAFSQEVQLVSDSDGPLNYTLGLHYYHEEGKDGFGAAGLAVDGGFGFANAAVQGLGKVSYDSLAPYFNVNYDISDKLELVVGGRYTQVDKTLDYNTVSVGSVTIPGGYDFTGMAPIYSAPKDKFESSKISPKAQLVWRPTEGVMLYAGYNKGFKAGGFNLPNPSPSPIEKVRDEQLEAIEAGFKTQFGPITFNGNYFHYEGKQLQVQITNPASGITSVVNAGASSTDGVEFEGTWYATDDLAFSGGVTYMKAEFDDFPNGPVNVPCAAAPSDPGCAALGGLGLASVVGVNLAGNKVPQAPDWTGNIRVNYNKDLTGDLGSINFFAVAAYTSDLYFTADNNFKDEAKTLVSGSVGWKSTDARLGVSLFGTNLTDEKYLTHMAPFTATGGWKVPGAPRQYGVRVSFNY
jgi:iron complex outermembrane receptor protein